MKTIIAADFAWRIECQPVENELIAGDKTACAGMIAGLRLLRIYRTYLRN